MGIGKRVFEWIDHCCQGKRLGIFHNDLYRPRNHGFRLDARWNFSNRKDSMRMDCLRRVWGLKILRTCFRQLSEIILVWLSVFSQWNMNAFVGPHRKAAKILKTNEKFSC